ncbi:MAG: hypothetical protein J6A41_05940 [Ruminiclostridium sp.]|nr:hypothetical protein [Ruminiclostridium sp.]
MAKRKVDGISVAIVILNILIVGVIITLCSLIYLYMSGQLEQTDVSNLGQETQEEAVMTTTAITTMTLETTTMETTTTTEISFETTPSDGEDAPIEVIEVDSYDESFFVNDLFIGDSISTGLLNYGYLSSSQVFAQIGLNPESAHSTEYDGYTAVTKAEELQPKRIYIMLGSNGLAYMGNTYMVQQMQSLVEQLREACPESYIYVISIPPVTKAHEAEGQETMAMVNGYNMLLKDMADEIGVIYLDLCAELQDSTGYFSATYAEADGLHFLGAAYKKMLSFVQKSIQGE